jgi:cell division transport system permease protein
MELQQAITRAARGMRDDARLHAVAISSLTIAFLCLGVALLVTTNLSEVADAWGRSARMTIFLRDGARTSDVTELRLAVEGLAEVTSVEHLTASAARERFLSETGEGSSLSSLPADAFPASLEIELAAGTTPDRTADIAARVAGFGAVEDVETYRSWFDRLAALLDAGRGIAIAIAFLVLCAVLFVVHGTIRLAVAGRRDEIEVMKLCGASDGFVRGPFVVEGAVQGLLSSLIAMTVLAIGFFVLRDHLDSTLAALAGIRTAFLSPAVALGVLFAGTLTGAIGSALSLRRYLVV